MDPETYRRASELFQEAVGLPLADRRGFVDERCGDDLELHGMVVALLEGDTEEMTGDPFATPLAQLPFDEREEAKEGAQGSDSGLDETFPRSFGRYTLLGLLGRGGMGIVYEAEQDQPRQRVALKMVARHAASPQALARFRREAEALGRLRHPGIAKVHDAGETRGPEGTQPYFAMELIRGRPIVEDARERGLDPRARVNRMADVCDAVHHAHENGVIHRDLKPDNVLVTDRGEAKVLDFGIARMTSELEGEESLLTIEGQAIGTLHYMSPEQLAGDSRRIGPASDVYSLGVMLFELLAERTPHDLRNLSLMAAIRHLESNDPPPLHRVSPRLRGDLSTIVTKALARDPAERYGSAAELGADLLRYLRHEPIEARPHSPAYRLRKFARRHRLSLAAGAVVVAALGSGTAVATWQAVLATRAQQESELSAKGARAVSDFLIKEVLMADTPEVAQGEAATLEQAFERAVARLHTLDEEPEVQASLYHTLGQAFLNLGEFPRAGENFERALAWRSANLGEDHEDSVASMLGLCSVLKRVPPYDDALEPQRRAYELSLAARGPEHPQTRQAHHNLGTLYHRLGRHREAEETLRPLVESLRAAGATDSLLTYEAMHSLSRVYTSTERWDEADAQIRGSAEGKARLLGELHPSTLTSRIAVGINVSLSGRSQQAIEEFEALMPDVVRVFGDDHPRTITLCEVLSRAIVNSGEELQRAEPLLRKAIRVHLADPAHDPSRLAHCYARLGHVLGRQGRVAEGREALREAVGLYRAIDEEHGGIEVARGWLAELEDSGDREGSR